MSSSHSTNIRTTLALTTAVVVGATLANSPENRFVRSPSPGHSDDDNSDHDNEEGKISYKDAFNKKIQKFYENTPARFRRPLEEIIRTFLDICTYINGESLERHNWGDKPVKLRHMPTDIDINSNIELFEKELLDALGKSYNESSIKELLWGDPQLGKRVHACIIMWISIFILKRPVLYIFRNMKIDQQQLQADIIGTDISSFSTKYIKKIFDKYVKDEDDEDVWKSYCIPELKIVSDKGMSNNDILNKLSNKDALRTNDILCCLGNSTQLDKINRRLNEYIVINNKLLDITVLIDEGDLVSPTASNDGNHKNDLRDTTLCEKAISKIMQKVRYVLFITGTGYSLLNNITTKLNEEITLLIKVSQIHRMVRGEHYYGLTNGRITFITDMVDPFFEKTKYNLHQDYIKNIRPIITKISERDTSDPSTPYNSLLLSENKYIKNHLEILEKILKDFPERFVIVFHGNCLRLYLSKDYDRSLKVSCISDTSSSRRLDDEGGVYGPPKYIDSNNNPLPNNYCYYEINRSKFNLKQVYKLLRILFENSENPVRHKTVITITGRYADRGYSFTSDDYEKYSMHLTDQYLTSHASINCVDILQRARIQGIYKDNMQITLWTTNEIKNLMQSFYVPFMNILEKTIMDCKNWEEIKEHIESVIYGGDLHFWKYMKYLDIKKKMKNQTPIKKTFDKKHNVTLFPIAGKTDIELTECIAKRTNLPEYTDCINTIKTDLTEAQFIEKYGVYDIGHVYKPIDNITTYEELCYKINKIPEIVNVMETAWPSRKIPLPEKPWFDMRVLRSIDGFFTDRMTLIEWKKQNIEDYVNNKLRNMRNKKENNLWNLAYDSNNQLYISLRYTTVKIMPKHSSSDYIRGTPFRMENGLVRYSSLNEDINIDALPEKYYFRGVDDWLCLHDSTKLENSIFSFEIRAPPPPVIPVIVNPPAEMVADPVPVEPVINPVLLFTQKHFHPTGNPRLRVGITDVYEVYKPWCNSQNITPLSRTKLQEELAALQYMYCTKKGEEKGVDMRGAPGKRGYNIMLSPITI